MASITLYPPTVPAYVNAFVASGDSGTCRLYFSLSKLSSSTASINGIHISVVKQTSGQSVINKVDNGAEGRYRAAGLLILNTKPIAVDGEDNLYYVDILNEDIKGGWTSGWIYKIQIRLSTVAYDGSVGQIAWLNRQANNFSEWSTYCTTKAISQPRITIPLMKNFDSSVTQASANSQKTYTLSLSTLEFSGSYSNADESETLYSYNIQLFDESGEIIEESGTQYSNQYYTPNQFYYLFRHEFENNERCTLKLSYSTINKFEESFTFGIIIYKYVGATTTIKVVSLENIDTIEDGGYVSNFKSNTTLTQEQDDGRIALSLYYDNATPYNGNLCVRRSDSRSGYSEWSDIKVFPLVNTIINNIGVFYDNTIESGVWYKYGVQIIESNGDRGILNVFDTPLLREFNYSYLIGEGGRTLKLQYNNEMSSYTYNYLESKTDTIGGKYPYITRNGNVEYRTIPINGLISFNMDENNLFTSDKELYTYDEVITSYQERRSEEDLHFYDYRREFDFREKVLSFLQDGQPKLFKSSTEGNIIVRLMNVAAQPNQSLNRMIYSFTSTAHEVAEDTMGNYLKYGFYELEDYLSSFKIYETKLGQLDLDFKIGDNIIDKIWEKYNHSNQNMAGEKISVERVHHLSLEFTDKPLKVLNNANEEILGNNFLYNGNKITVRADGTRYYLFDDDIVFTKGSNITVLGGLEDIYDSNGNIINTVHITVNFLYEESNEPYTEKEIETRTSSSGVGQLHNNYKAGSNLYNELYYKYYYNWDDSYRKLANISWCCIEANPGTVFYVKDEGDTSSAASSMYHEIGQTGILNFENLGAITAIRHVGKRDKETGKIITENANADISLDYIFNLEEGTYKEE